MDPYATSYFSHATLRHELETLVARDCATTAVLLSRIGEFDERRLFLPEGYPSMYAFCVHELHFCEGTASRRIYAARAARCFPLLFVAVADGRLHLTAVVMLSRYLTAGNVDELVAAATHRSKAEIERLIASRFPQPDLADGLRAITHAPPSATAAPPGDAHSLENVEAGRLAAPGSVRQHSLENVHGALPPAAPPVPGRPVAAPVVESQRSRVAPLAPERFGLQCTLDRETYDLLQQARALMSHQNPAGEIVPVLKSALKLLVGQLEQRKYAATSRPGRARPTTSARHIPAAVKRAVRERDGEQCAFVSEAGQRCPERARLQFDHVEPLARGGAATVDNVRLVCAAHNAYAAERAFGAEFMDHKRREARARAAKAQHAPALARATWALRGTRRSR